MRRKPIATSKPPAPEVTLSRMARSKSPAATTVRPRPRPRQVVKSSALPDAPHTSGTHDASHAANPRSDKLHTNSLQLSHKQNGLQSADHNRGISSQTAPQDSRRLTATHHPTSHAHNASPSQPSSPSPPPPDEVLKQHLDKRKARTRASSSRLSPTTQPRAPTAHSEAIGHQRKLDEPLMQQRQLMGGQSHPSTSNTAGERSSASQGRGARESVASQPKERGSSTVATRPRDGAPQNNTAGPGVSVGGVSKVSTAGSKTRVRNTAMLQIIQVPPPQLPGHTTVSSFSRTCNVLTFILLTGSHW